MTTRIHCWVREVRVAKALLPFETLVAAAAVEAIDWADARKCIPQGDTVRPLEDFTFVQV
jgi:hypothetical protein